MSLRARILGLVLAASLLPVLVMAWMLFDQRAATSAQAREQLLARAEGLAKDLDDKVAGTAQLLFGLARVPILNGPDKPACSDFLADVLREHPQYTGLLTILPDGSLHCDSLRSGRVLNLSDRDYFQRAVKSVRHVVEPVFGRLTGMGVLQIAYPVRDAGGALKFVLLASLNLEEYVRSAATAMSPRAMGFQVWRKDGLLITQYPRPPRQPGGGADGLADAGVDATAKQFVLSDLQGQALLLGTGAQARIWVATGLPRSGEAGVRLVLSVSEADLLVQVNRRFQRTLVWLGSLTLLFLGVAAVLAEFALRRQASRVMSAISRLDHGDFGAPIGRPYPRGELGEVMAALDRLGGSLETHRLQITRSNEALERQANYDPLTGLANRHLLTDRLEQALIHAHRADRVVAVLVLDLDRFKTVNDSLGHSKGDLLLQEVAQRLRASVREGDTVARLGGDEFVVVLTDVADVADTVPVAQKILAALARPLRIGSQQVTACASLGVSTYPRDAQTADALLGNADTAMYRAKDQGGDAFEFFTPEMNQAVIERLQVEAGLRRALAQGELRLYYQPIVDMTSGRITSAEALVRWRDPVRGLVLPDHFIAVAEETGLIVPLGNWVLQEACAQVARWQAQGLAPISVAVNLSARQFRDQALEASVEEALRSSGCPPQALQLEITESMVMHQTERALLTMHRLNSLGVRLAIDDFGTGYSSLSYLSRFPVHKLKIDRSFVRDIHVSSTDEAIVEAILLLARKLGMRTVAEGVETATQFQFLRSLGCDEYQGYYFARPCPADEFTALLTAGTVPG